MSVNKVSVNSVTNNIETDVIVLDNDIGQNDDLTIEDEHSNIILLLNSGNIQTKQFNSLFVPKIESSDKDLEISDEQGNILVEFSNGHIRTNNFNSRYSGSGSASSDKLSGKTFSIIGDSISTYQGYLVSDKSGYSGTSYVYYYPSGNVDNVQKCWWKILENDLNLELISNCSWSGSLLTGEGGNTQSASAGCSNKRVSDVAFGGRIPDIIIVYIGINDFSSQRAIGTYTSKNPFPEDGTKTTFSEALALLLSKLMKQYPYARIFVCTLISTIGGIDRDGHSGEEGYPTAMSNGTTLNEYNETIREITQAYGLDIIELAQCGIRHGNVTKYTIDNALHPNYAGHQLIANKIKNELLLKI